MAVTARFEANFESFNAAVAAATAKLHAFNNGIKPIQPSLNTMVGGTNSVVTSFGKLVASFITAQAAIAGVKAVFGTFVGSISDSITAASEAEKAHVQVAAALRAQGTAIPSVIAAYQGYASALERTTIFQDDALEGATALLVQIGNVMPRDMKAALTATTELASGLGINLEQAATMVAKAATGTTTGLKKLGVETTDVKGKALGFGDVLDSITEKFGGQAAAIAGTYEGRLIQLGNTWNNVEESIGRVITQNATLLQAFGFLSDAIATNTGELGSNSAATNFVSDAVIIFVKTLALGGTAAGVFADKMTSTVVELLALEQQVLRTTTTTLLLVRTFGEASNNQLMTAFADVMLRKVSERAKDVEDSLIRGIKATVNAGAMFKVLADSADALAADLETTRGKTVALTGATAGGADAWKRNTESLNKNIDATKKAADAAEKLKKSQKEAAEKLDQMGWSALDAQKTMRLLGDTGAQSTGMIVDGLGAALLKMEAFTAAAKDLPKFDLGALFDMGKIAPPDMKDFKQTIRTSLSDVFRDGPDLFVKAFTGGGGMRGALKAFGVQISEAVMKPLWTELSKASKAAVGFGSALSGALGQATGLGQTTNAVIGVGTGLAGAAVAASAWGTGMAAAGVAGTVALGAATLGIGAAAVGVALLIKKFTGVSAEVKAARTEVEGFQTSLWQTMSAQQVVEAGGEPWKATVIAVRDAYLETGRSAEEALKAAEGLWDTDHPDRMAQAIREVNQAMGELNDAVDYEDLTKKAEAYGIQLSDLGPQFKQANISGTAKTIHTDFLDLLEAGGDVNGVMLGMRDEVSKLLGDAKKFGSAIPPAMEPMINTFLNAGLLVDDSGDKLTDLSGITFAESPLEKGLADLTQATRDLIEALGGVPSKIGAIASAPVPKIRIPVEYDYEDVDPGRRFGRQADYASMGGLVTASGIQHFGGGGKVLPWRPRGTDTVPAMLTPGETVYTAAQEAARTRGGGGTIVVPVNLDGHEITRVVVRLTPDVLRELGVG